MKTSSEAYEFCKDILENYSIYKDHINISTGCFHDRSKERELYERRTEEKLEAIGLFCKEGNILFAKNDYEGSITEYMNALIYIDYTFPETFEEEKELQRLKIRVHLNMAACKLKLKIYNDVQTHCRIVLDLDPKNIKAIYRSATAYFEDHKYDEALERLSLILINIEYSKNNYICDDKDRIRESQEHNKDIVLPINSSRAQVHQDDIECFIKLRNLILNMKNNYNKESKILIKKMMNVGNN
ncbi:uncharacterized protein CMU_041500 [Cryptosporidium muris RN66]|uniref:Uncharacterized protein n=1 Tax=Cryptosporidium muris (strain RN66) TaxID=441375 RepID=B6AA38_CRYMR|nr:uncharacterized protein CMU_041500 [Cryptosporidium muris RN66]EEA05079.1 hypothetical protein, conserved [Cryptosporidium muris RN66]|eukprot:XP_002139428.1 hypothetical protein [Cryptosporidium muris RN66]